MRSFSILEQMFAWVYLFVHSIMWLRLEIGVNALRVLCTSNMSSIVCSVLTLPATALTCTESSLTCSTSSPDRRVSLFKSFGASPPASHTQRGLQRVRDTDHNHSLFTSRPRRKVFFESCSKIPFRKLFYFNPCFRQCF